MVNKLIRITVDSLRANYSNVPTASLLNNAIALATSNITDSTGTLERIVEELEKRLNENGSLEITSDEIESIDPDALTASKVLSSLVKLVTKGKDHRKDSDKKLSELTGGLKRSDIKRVYLYK
jgi:transcriptional regulator NrdR family protein